MKPISHLCIIYSFTMLVSAAARPAISDRAIRIPLERRSRGASDTISPQSVKSGQFLGADRVQGLVNSAHRKYAATFAAYERNTGSRHPLDTHSRSFSAGPSKPPGSGSVQLVNDQSVMWYGPIFIGTPPQKFEMDFDTGSADPWVPSDVCPLTCEGHNTYHASQSSTSHGEPDPHVMVYGTGEAATIDLYADDIAVAGIMISRQQFGVVNFLSPDFWNSLGPFGSQFLADGIFGLGFSNISALEIKSPVENLQKMRNLPEGFFSFQLSDPPKQSELIIGDANYAAFKTDTLVCSPLTFEGYWQIAIGGIRRFGSQVVTAISAAAIVDTGTTLIVVPTDVANEYFSGIADCSRGICSVPCDVIDSTRPTLTIEGRDFQVCPSTWDFGPVGIGGVPGHCYTGMATSDQFDFVIIGDVFLRNVYSIFDFRDLRVCFADLKVRAC